MTLWFWILLLLFLSFANFAYAMVQIKKFLSHTSIIETRKNLEDFKRFVRAQMYQTLAQLGFQGGSLLLCLFGIFSRNLRFGQILLFLILNGIIIILGRIFRKTEDDARSLLVEDENLKEEYEAVCHTWTKRPLPDF